MTTTQRSRRRPEITLDELRNRSVVTPDETGVLLDTSTRVIYQMVHRHELPVIRVGSNFKIPAAHIRRLLGLDDTDSITDQVGNQPQSLVG
ncbi:helix-turn-helix domain-containing protein [Candidatus Nanopelagicales bacterium]|nr:helix-turn-helix domain-containing protein [Candidatus Nanopelagicales bacterium]